MNFYFSILCIPIQFRLIVINFRCLQIEKTQMSFSGKVVILTGASSGIGFATAEYLAKQDASLALVGRNEEQLQKAVDSCLKHTENVLKIIADVTIEADAERIIRDTVAKFGKLNVLINSGNNDVVYCVFEIFIDMFYI